LEKHGDGSWSAGARTPLEDLEQAMGQTLFSEEERDEVDTLGGLVFTIAGRIPTRGELLVHDLSGLEFEVLDVDPRFIKRLRIRSPLELSVEEQDDRDANVWKGVGWAEELLKDDMPTSPSDPKKSK